MFRGCSSLTNLDVNKFNTSNVTNMSCLFYGCSSLTNLDVSHFNTNSVTEMNGMFRECSSLIALDVSKFNTSKVVRMGEMFWKCSNLVSLDVSHFNTSSVKSMSDMFYYCSGLASLDVSNFNTSNVKNMSSMFQGCSGLTNLDVSSFKTGIVEDMYEMFGQCSSVEQITFDEGFETSEDVNNEYMFHLCRSLKCIEFKGQIPAHVKANFFDRVGRVDAPATLLVPEEYKADYQAKFNGNMFFGGYFSLEGRESPSPVVDAVTLTARNYSRQYGDNNPKFDFVVSEGTLKSGTPSITCTATATSPVGTYPIVIAKGSVGNGEVTLVNGTLTITEAPLTVSVGNYTRKVGESNPEFKLSYSGFKNGDTESVLSKMPSVSCTAKASSASGLYPITISGAEAQNYSFKYNNGTLTVISSLIPDPNPNASPYAVLNDGTLTFYCDTLRAKRQGDVYVTTGYPNWIKRATEIKKVVFDPSFGNARPTSTGYWFNGCNSLKEIDGLAYLDTRNVTDMGGMFSSCSSLTSLDVSNFDTHNVLLMDNMFIKCSNLTSLDVSKFDTKNVTRMNSMFDRCSNLTSLDVSSFDTHNVLLMDDMFNGCSSLTNLDVSKFDTQNVTSMSSMFDLCNNLTSLDVSKFDTHNVTSMHRMFNGCSNLTSLDVSKFVTQNVTSMSRMFNECSNLTSIDVSNFDTQKVTSMMWMFRGCSNVTSLDVSKFDTHSVTNMVGMFDECSNLKSIDVSNFDTQNVTSMSSMFWGCSNLKSIDVSNFDTQNVDDNDMYLAFGNCSSLTNIVIGSQFTSDDSNYLLEMFRGCDKLVNVIFTGDIPASIHSTFFHSVGTPKDPVILNVPDQYRDHYAAKFDGNKFFGGYFTLSGSSAQKIGDLNKDGEVNGTDLVLLVDYVLQGNNDEEAADLNGDGQVNGTDIVVLVNLIMDAEPSNAREVMTRSNDISNASVSIEPLHIGAGESRKMTISVSNPDMDVTMMQFDMVLPKGLRVNRIGNYMEYELTDRTSNNKHSAYIRDNGDFTRLLIASGTNAILDGNEGGVIRLTLTSDDDFEGGNIEFRNMLCTSPDLQEARPQNFTAYISGNTTGIHEIGTEDKGGSIYNLSGQRLKTMHKGLNILNGKKIVVK